MAKFSEITDKAEKLVESGETAKREVQQCVSRVSAASSQLQAAQKQLEQAKETDEDGKPKGNVSGAQSAVAVAQGKLAASRRALQDAKSKVSSINAQKQAQIRKIEAHNSVEKNNLSQLKKLQGLAFAGDNEALYKGIVERMNSAEQAKASLKKSLGLENDVEEEQIDEGFASFSYENDINLRNRVNASDSTAYIGAAGNRGYSSGFPGGENSSGSITNSGSHTVGKSMLVSATGEVVNKEDLIKNYNEAISSGDEEGMNKYRTLFELNSFYNELELTDGDVGVIQEGGLYKDLKTYDGYERHHIPSGAVQEKNKGNLPVIAITKEDHSLTDSYKWKQNKKNKSFLGESFEQYKVEASDMISGGKYAELVKAEVLNIIEKNGHKYDGGLKGYFQALYTMIEKEGVPQAHVFREGKDKDAITIVNDNSPMGKLTKYMSDHNYGINDYGTYSKDPEWIALHSAVFGSEKNDNKYADGTRLQDTHKGRINIYPEKIKSIIGNVSNADKKINSLRASEILNSIERFTGDEYELIRSVYSSNNNSPVKNHIDNIDFFVNNAPRWNGKVYRGINVNKSTRDSILNGGIIDMKGPASWSTSEHTAKSFSGHGIESVKMVFVLPDNVSGASVTHLSTYGTMEEEVISPSSSRYKIDKAFEQDGYTYVYLHEKIGD